MNIPEGYKITEQSKDRIVLERVKDYDWVPKDGQDRWYVGVDGAMWNDISMDSYVEAELTRFGNVYPSEELAEKAAKLMRRSNQIIRACLLVDPDYEPDWTLFSCKYYPARTRSDAAINEWRVTYTRLVDSSKAYVSSEEKCREVIKLLEKWGVE